MLGAGLMGGSAATLGGAGAYHGFVAPPHQMRDYNQAQGELDKLTGQYGSDIEAVRSGQYNPNTGSRQGDWFGHTMLPDDVRQRLAKEMKDKLDAAKAGTGSLGNYSGKPGTLWNGQNWEQLRDKALGTGKDIQEKGIQQPGVIGQLLGAKRALPSEAENTAMKEFIKKYGGGKRPADTSRYAYIGGRPVGPMDFTNYPREYKGHDYGAFYRPSWNNYDQ